MPKLAQLNTSNVAAVSQSETYTASVALTANTPESITVPTDSETGEKAGYIVFGLPVGTDFYARAFNTQDGYERVTNGNFATDTDWTKGAGWSIGSGVATATGAISTSLSQTANGAYPLVQGQAYLVTYIATQSAGSITINVGGTAGTARSSSATFTEVIIAGSTQTIEFTTSGFTGTVDDLSIKACASVPVDSTAGYSARLNPAGINLGTTPSYISLVSAGTPVITASFYKR